MGKYKYSETEKKINSVLKYQSNELDIIKELNTLHIDNNISSSEELLKSLGYEKELDAIRDLPNLKNKQRLCVPEWDVICNEARKIVGEDIEFEDLFSESELKNNDEVIKELNREFNQIHHLDKFDIGICAIAGIISAAVDILLVGIPEKGIEGVKGGKLSDYIRKKFGEKFPADEMEKLAKSKVSKVPYDAQDNRNTSEYVEGLSAYYHRLLSLGHDPILGFIFGVFDILTGRMTTIDKNGKMISQIVSNYADRKENDIFAAIAKQILHLKTDVTTSMGLPAPLMSLFNFLQIGSIGEEDATIAEIVQGMYFEGYDFIHFCSMTVPVMITEVIVRIGYSFKRIKEGYNIKDSIPFSLNREKHPKLNTMLFIGHSAATVVNAGKIIFTKNPMEINYPQWMAFAIYSYKQLKWLVQDKANIREEYVLGKINEKLKIVYKDIDAFLDEEYLIVFD